METPLIDHELLEILVDPLTGERLEVQGNYLVGKSNKYVIKDGVPILIWKENS